MKAVLALLIVCLIQISFAEQENVADDASSVANLLLQREVREAGKGGCEPGDKKCKRQLRKDQRKERKRLRKGEKQSRKNRKKTKTSKTKKSKKGGKKGGKGERKKSTRKLKGEKRQKKNGKPKKKTSDKKRRQKKKPSEGNKGQAEDVKGSRSSSASGSGRQTTSQCFTDMVAKTKKFNKAQVEFRLAKRIESWGKLMKNKKENSNSTFSDSLDAINDATKEKDKRQKEKTKEETEERKGAGSGFEGVQIFISKWKWKEHNWPVLHRHGCQDKEVQQSPG